MCNKCQVLAVSLQSVTPEDFSVALEKRLKDVLVPNLSLAIKSKQKWKETLERAREVVSIL